MQTNFCLCCMAFVLLYTAQVLLMSLLELYPGASRVVVGQSYLYLSFFQCFARTHNVSSLQKDEAQKVILCIHGCGLEHGYLCEMMEALNVPLADTPVSSSFVLRVQH